jgi:hypothetical protein
MHMSRSPLSHDSGGLSARQHRRALEPRLENSQGADSAEDPLMDVSQEYRKMVQFMAKMQSKQSDASHRKGYNPQLWRVTKDVMLPNANLQRQRAKQPAPKQVPQQQQNAALQKQQRHDSKLQQSQLQASHRHDRQHQGHPEDRHEANRRQVRSSNPRDNVPVVTSAAVKGGTGTMRQQLRRAHASAAPGPSASAATKYDGGSKSMASAVVAQGLTGSSSGAISRALRESEALIRAEQEELEEEQLDRQIMSQQHQRVDLDSRATASVMSASVAYTGSAAISRIDILESTAATTRAMWDDVLEWIDILESEASIEADLGIQLLTLLQAEDPRLMQAYRSAVVPICAPLRPVDCCRALLRQRSSLSKLLNPFLDALLELDCV